MKNSDVLYNFVHNIQGRNISSSLSIRYDRGNMQLVSYNTCIAQWDTDRVLVNLTKYSSTTTRSQNELIRQLNKNNIHYLELYNIPENTDCL